MAVDWRYWYELDPNSRVTRTANKLTVTDLDGDDGDCFICNDYGAGHFGTSGWTHTFSWKPVSSTGAAYVVVWAVSNVHEDMKYWWANHSQAVSLWQYDTRIYLENHETDISQYYTGGYGTTYYVTVDRPETTQIRARIYSDATRETLVATLTVTVDGARTYQHLYSVNNWPAGGGGCLSFELENLDIGEGGGGSVVPVHMDNYRRRRVA